MVHLVLSSTKGNQGLRYFPYVGYLGLTPVRVEGVVRTRLDDDAKHLLAKSISISVRCYEARLGRVSVLHSNVLVDYTQVLWSKPNDVEYAPIDNLEFPFRINIPTKVAGFSTAIFVDYRCMWRVEAVLNHAPLSALGSFQVKHFELPLIRFDIPPHPSSPLLPRPIFREHTTKPRAPTIRYCYYPPTSPIGPLDLVSIPVFLSPLDDAVSIRSATVMIERRLQLNEANGHSYPSHSPINLSQPTLQSPPLHSESTPSSQELSSLHANISVISDLSSNPTITPHSIHPFSSSISISSETQPLLHPSHPSTSSPTSQTPSKIIITPIVGAESSGQFVRDNEGVWSRTLTLQWPAAKSHSRWAIGETIQSDLVSVKFFVRIKVTVSSVYGTESLELREQELVIVSTNEAERHLALSKYNELINNTVSQSSRSKSKSPRRLRRDPDLLDLPPSPAPPGKFKNGSNSTGDVAEDSAGHHGSKVVRPRRPHTSAGPRDKSFEFARRPEQAYVQQGSDPSGSGVLASGSESNTTRPCTSPSEVKRRSGMVYKGYSFFSSAPRLGATASGSSTATSGSGSMTASTSRSTTSSASSNASHAGNERDRTREEWEAELAKIEVQSRKSSDILGFASKAKRWVGTVGR